MSKKPAAAFAPPIVEQEQKKEKPKKELDPVLLERLKQLNPSELHSSTPLQHIINTLVEKECCSIASLQRAIKNNRLEQWFPNAEVTWDAIKELVPASGSMTAQPSDGYAKENNELLKSIAATLKPLDLSMSKVTAGQWDEIAADLGIDAAGLQTFPDATTTDAPVGFTWNQCIQESHQAEEYLSWMQTVLKDCASVVVVKGSEVDLSIPRLAAMPRSLHGKSDLVILFHAVHQTPEARSGIVFVMELKKKIEPIHAAQLKAQLLAASYHSKQRPVGVLTDLRDDWYFYWFEQKNNKSTLCAAKAARARALGWIRLRCAELPAKEAASMSARARSPRKSTARATSPKATSFPFSAATQLPLYLVPPAWAELPAYEAGLLGENEAVDLRFSMLMYSLLHAPGVYTRAV